MFNNEIKSYWQISVYMIIYFMYIVYEYNLAVWTTSQK